jgi:hypothetical protein
MLAGATLGFKIDQFREETRRAQEQLEIAAEKHSADMWEAQQKQLEVGAQVNRRILNTASGFLSAQRPADARKFIMSNFKPWQSARKIAGLPLDTLPMNEAEWKAYEETLAGRAKSATMLENLANGLVVAQEIQEKDPGALEIVRNDMGDVLYDAAMLENQKKLAARTYTEEKWLNEFNPVPDGTKGAIASYVLDPTTGKPVKRYGTRIPKELSLGTMMAEEKFQLQVRDKFRSYVKTDFEALKTLGNAQTMLLQGDKPNAVQSVQQLLASGFNGGRPTKEDFDYVQVNRKMSDKLKRLLLEAFQGKALPGDAEELSLMMTGLEDVMKERMRRQIQGYASGNKSKYYPREKLQQDLYDTYGMPEEAAAPGSSGGQAADKARQEARKEIQKKLQGMTVEEIKRRQDEVMGRNQGAPGRQ